MLLLDQLVAEYGYWAVLLGTFLEGETTVVLGGLAAKFGHLELHGVVLAAIIGTVVGDQLCFLIGRRYGKTILAKRPGWQARARRVDTLIVKWDIYLVLSFRFMYGLRSVASFTLGMSSIDFRKFVILNLIGATIWAVVMAYTGYFIGTGAELVFGDLQGKGVLVVLAAAAAGALVWGSLLWRRARRLRTPAKCPDANHAVL